MIKKILGLKIQNKQLLFEQLPESVRLKALDLASYIDDPLLGLFRSQFRILNDYQAEVDLKNKGFLKLNAGILSSCCEYMSKILLERHLNPLTTEFNLKSIQLDFFDQTTPILKLHLKIQPEQLEQNLLLLRTKGEILLPLNILVYSDSDQLILESELSWLIQTNLNLLNSNPTQKEN